MQIMDKSAKLDETLMEKIRARKALGEQMEISKEEAAILFIDLSGSTNYKLKKEMHLGVEKVVIFNITVTEIIKEYFDKINYPNWRICKYIGDEVMLYILGDDASNYAVGVASEVQSKLKIINEKKIDELEKYKAKIGIDIGKVFFIKFSDNMPLDPYGTAVDRCARIVSLAKPYQILVSEDVRSRITIEGIRLSDIEQRQFKGFNEKTGIYELVWDEISYGIATSEPSKINYIESDKDKVWQFIIEHDFLNSSKQIDLGLYTAESILTNLKDDLIRKSEDIGIETLRVLIRNKKKDQMKKHKIASSVTDLRAIVNNKKLNIMLRFYDSEPTLRSIIFTKKDNHQKEGLLGIYKYDENDEFRFIGTEGNILIYARSEDKFEAMLLDIYKSRFDYIWDKLSDKRAVIFNLDCEMEENLLNHRKELENAIWLFKLLRDKGLELCLLMNPTKNEKLKEFINLFKIKIPINDIMNGDSVMDVYSDALEVLKKLHDDLDCAYVIEHCPIGAESEEPAGLTWFAVEIKRDTEDENSYPKEFRKHSYDSFEELSKRASI